MEPVSRLNKLLEILRQKQAQSSKTSKNKRTETAKEISSAEYHTIQSHDIAELKSLVSTRLQHLSLKDIEDGKATAPLIEIILTWEFGTQLLDDPEFAAVAKKLEETMMQDTKTRKMITSTLNELIST